MEQRLVCDTVRDLFPMYIDHMTSDASNGSIEEHIGRCSECRTVLEQMREPVPVETAPEVAEFKKFLKKSKLDIFYWIMGAAAVIAVLTCFIVNLAVEKRLSWFYIVLAGILTGYFPIYVAVNGREHRILKMLASLNACVILLLGVIQLVLYYRMGIGGVWFWDTGLPVTALWTVLVWAAVVIRVKLHGSVLTALAVFAVLAVFGNYQTNVICGYYKDFGDYAENFVSNGLGNVVAAALLFVIDIMVHVRKGKSRYGK